MAGEVPGCTSWTSHGQRCSVPYLALGSTHGLGRQPSPSHMRVLLPELQVQCKGYRCPQLREAPNSFSSLNSLCMYLDVEQTMGLAVSSAAASAHVALFPKPAVELRG